MEPKDWPEDMRLALLDALIERDGYTLPTPDIGGFRSEGGKFSRVVIHEALAGMTATQRAPAQPSVETLGRIKPVEERRRELRRLTRSQLMERLDDLHAVHFLSDSSPKFRLINAVLNWEDRNRSEAVSR